MVDKGESHSNGCFRGTPIYGNSHIVKEHHLISTVNNPNNLSMLRFCWILFCRSFECHRATNSCSLCVLCFLIFLLFAIRSKARSIIPQAYPNLLRRASELLKQFACLDIFPPALFHQYRFGAGIRYWSGKMPGSTLPNAPPGTRALHLEIQAAEADAGHDMWIWHWRAARKRPCACEFFP